MKKQLTNFFTRANFFTFKGRCTSFQYFIASLVIALVLSIYIILCMCVYSIAFGEMNFSITNLVQSFCKSPNSSPMTIFMVLSGILVVGFSSLSTISFLVRRFHDVGLSGKWLWLYFLFACAVSLVPWLVCLSHITYAIPGTEGPNRFGPEVGKSVENEPIAVEAE